MVKRLTEEDKKEIRRLELEKIKIEHQNELNHTNQFLWMQGTRSGILLTAIFGFILYKFDFSSTIAALLLVFYLVLIVRTRYYLIQMEYEGNPKSFLNWIPHILLNIFSLDWIKKLINFFCKNKFTIERNKGLKGTYEKKIDELIKDIKK